MAYQPFNFANIEPLGESSMRNLVDNLMKGYQAYNMPRETQLAQEEKRLRNALLQSQGQYAGPLAESQLQLLKAQIGGEYANTAQKQFINNLMADPNALAQVLGGRGAVQPTMPGNARQENVNVSESVEGYIPPEYRPDDNQHDDIINALEEAQNANQPSRNEPEYVDQFKEVIKEKGVPQAGAYAQSNESRAVNPQDELRQALIRHYLNIPKELPFEQATREISTEKQKDLNKAAIKFKESLADDYSDNNNLLNNLDYLVNILERSPNTSEIVGPVNSWLTKVTGNAEERKLLGEIANASGNIALDAAKSIKGAFTGRDLSLLNSVKPNPKDTYGEFLGKLKGMSSLSRGVQSKIEYIDKLLDAGYPRLQAEKIARENVNFDNIRDEVELKLESAYPLPEGVTQEDIEYTAKVNKMTPSEVRRRIRTGK